MHVIYTTIRHFVKTVFAWIFTTHLIKKDLSKIHVNCYFVHKTWRLYKTVLHCLHLFTLMLRLIACKMKLKYADCLSPKMALSSLMFKSVLSTWHSSFVIFSHSILFLTGLLLLILGETTLELFVLFLWYRNMCYDFCESFL